MDLIVPDTSASIWFTHLHRLDDTKRVALINAVAPPAQMAETPVTARRNTCRPLAPVTAEPSSSGSAAGSAEVRLAAIGAAATGAS